MRKLIIFSGIALGVAASTSAGCAGGSNSGQNNQRWDAQVTVDAMHLQDAQAQVDAMHNQDAQAQVDAAQNVDAGQNMDAAQNTDAGPNEDAAQSIDAAQNQDAGTQPDPLGFGSACECQGNGCDKYGVPVPNGGGTGTIVGCDHVDQPWTGADLVCMRTYTGSLAEHTYFANGYCALMATKCTGTSLICNSAEFGDYDTMTACPTGTVMIQQSQTVTVLGQQATIDSKVCVKACDGGPNECREGETDPLDNDQPTQYQCIDKNGVQFCYDPRDLQPQYTATQY